MKAVCDELSDLQAKGLFRTLSHRKGIDFASNDYLGFSRNSALRALTLKHWSKLDETGSTGSRLISGNSDFIEATEDFLAQAFQSEAALIFGSGYLANLGILSALGGDGVEFFSDELNHVSIIDGIRLARSSYHVYPHCQMEQLERALKSSSAKRKVVITESVFSMDGDLAPLKDIGEAAGNHDAFVILDEAHAIGVFGDQGKGLCQSEDFDPEKLIRVYPCGKALGGYGAFVCCSRPVKDLLVNKARTFIFSTAPPPVIVAQIRASIETLFSQQNHLISLRSNCSELKRLFQEKGLSHSGFNIVPYRVPGNEEVTRVASFLQDNQYFVRAIRFPTVPKGTERLRLTLKSFHTSFQLKELCTLLEGLARD